MRADIATHFKYLVEDPLTLSLAKRQATGAIRSPIVRKEFAIDHTTHNQIGYLFANWKRHMFTTTNST